MLLDTDQTTGPKLDENFEYEYNNIAQETNEGFSEGRELKVQRKVNVTTQCLLYPLC